MRNKKVQFVEEIFGIILPEFKIHVSSREIESELLVEDGIVKPAKWRYFGNVILSPELEIYLPKEGMSPKQATEQLEICSAIARGGENDSSQLYSQKVMMNFHSTAIKNCIYLASLDYNNWNLNLSVLPGCDDTYLGVIKDEMAVFREAFSRERPSRFRYQREMGHLFLRLLLENNAPLNKGEEVDAGLGRKHVHYNTLFKLLLSGFTEEHSYSDHNDLNKYVHEFMGYKCREVTEKLMQLND
jgi:hypothetical protein